ncbi:U11/U12 small nuclear ribonucleoprotein 35 kDa protein [Anabrus simplex]|uniref:U11/U12 small nuclear ribonucleoprotein 35 kDa protein n=1 Tax=Anabrus simplex TaxID=316456 RepID=UPI0034DD48CE
MAVWSTYKYYDPLKAGSIDGTDTEPHDRAIVRALTAEYICDPKVEGRPECTIFISRLTRETTERQVKSFFSNYGTIRRCRLVRDIVTGVSKCYAFVEYERSSSAKHAYVSGNRGLLNGSEVFVDFECERVLPGWVPRRLGGGFGGKKESGQLRFGGRARPFRKPLIADEQLRRSSELFKIRDEKPISSSPYGREDRCKSNGRGEGNRKSESHKSRDRFGKSRNYVEEKYPN